MIELPHRPRVVVCGSRTFDDYVLFRRTMDRLTRAIEKPIICHGGGYKYVQHVFSRKGADFFAERWACERLHTIMIFHPDVERFRSPACFHRARSSGLPNGGRRSGA